MAGFTSCHNDSEVADHTCYLIQSQYIDPGPTSPGTDPVEPDVQHGTQKSFSFNLLLILDPEQREVKPDLMHSNAIPL